METAIAATGAVIGDPVRAAMLVALMDGRALPAGELAFLGNVAPQTASFHLGKLVEAGLISVERQGKHRYYRIADERVGYALESMAALTVPSAGQRTVPEPARKHELRFARSCYKHLAGHMAVAIFEALLGREFIVRGEGRNVALTGRGSDWLRQSGLCSRPQSNAGITCLDWTERRAHLGGPLGVNLFAYIKEAGWVVQQHEGRAVRLTHLGQQRLQAELSVAIRL
jgi:DNA-binding transcriptional ArsR family regulator